jgi:hypothetical protein
VLVLDVGAGKKHSSRGDGGGGVVVDGTKHIEQVAGTRHTCISDAAHPRQAFRHECNTNVLYASIAAHDTCRAANVREVLEGLQLGVEGDIPVAGVHGVHLHHEFTMQQVLLGPPHRRKARLRGRGMANGRVEDQQRRELRRGCLIHFAVVCCCC